MLVEDPVFSGDGIRNFFIPRDSKGSSKTLAGPVT